MKEYLLVSLALLFYSAGMGAQTLTEAEVTAKMNEAIDLDKAKKTSEALGAYLIVGKNTELQRTEYERQVYVGSQTMAIMCYEKLKRYEEAYLLAKKLMDGNLSDNERQDVEHLYATNGYLYCIGFIKRKVGQYEKGRAILEEIAPYADGKLKDYVLPKIPLSWYFEGADYFLNGKYDKALECYQRALKGYRALGMPKDEIKALRQIGTVRWVFNDLAASADAYREALSLARTTGDTGVQMEMLKELWKIEKAVGNVSLAQTYAASMDSLVMASSDTKVKYDYCGQKGDEAKNLGLYGIAEQWYLRGQGIAERAGTALAPADKYKIYADLESLYSKSGRYDEALQYVKKYMSEYEIGHASEDSGYDALYADMADIYRMKGDKEGCYSCIEKLLASGLQKTEAEALYPIYITSGRCHFHFKDYEAALRDYKKADELLAAKYPQTYTFRVALLALQGGAYHRLGQYDESERCYRKYAEYAKTLYGDSSLEDVNASIYLANAEGYAGHVKEGCADYAQASRQLRTIMRQRVPYMSVSEREELWTPLSSLFTMMTPYALEAKQYQTDFTKDCYDALVLSKSFLLESERSMYEVIKKNGTDENVHDYTVMASMNNRIKMLENDYEEYADSILSMSRKVSRMETALAGRCKAYTESTDFLNVDYAAVKSALGPEEVLVDFTDYISESQGRKYAAYVVDNVQKYPLLRPLFAESVIDSLGIVRPDMYYDEDYAHDVVRLLWKPLENSVSEGMTIYYVPSQLLFQVSLESLPMEDGTLLGSHYHFVRLSSARELVRMKRRREPSAAHDAVLYGGLKYDVDDMTMAAEAEKYDVSALCAARGGFVRGDYVFHDLPGSKDEVTKIAFILEKYKWNVKLYTGAEGTEESFLSMHGKSPRILQIATHGFYYTPGEAEKIDYLRGYTDAMSLSGLVMSGGNAAWSGKVLPKGVLGGILTANDIARLDLGNTDMVVLSACKSGQGKATAEGLYGLQRAFKKAGAGTVVMTLWNVSDKVTAEFMTVFYERLMSPMSMGNKRMAFEEAKDVIRKKYPSPFLWAPFVMLD